MHVSMIFAVWEVVTFLRRNPFYDKNPPPFLLSQVFKKGNCSDSACFCHKTLFFAKDRIT